ncbi:threonine synthase-like 2 [Sceloporus undulatus]|uniref:threonine synthase-like 2 n=1 Tax=Sceloporus undulatus TaxID=8520 RepID=UPI001C4C698B|nr:threonine synthase-like 2 [Sceloporus undulatus]
MRYVSTRGGAGSTDFEGALFSGYAIDGGLFMPESIPVLDFTTLKTWSSFSYPELVKQLCSMFISPELIPKPELNDLIDRAFSRFKHKEVVHLSRLKNGLNVLELWHGATYAFKDLSLSCTGQFLQYFLKKRKKHVTILVGTSGDTGSSAIESVRGEKNVDIFVLLPHGLCSKVQELQMTTGDNTSLETSYETCKPLALYPKVSTTTTTCLFWSLAGAIPYANSTKGSLCLRTDPADLPYFTDRELQDVTTRISVIHRLCLCKVICIPRFLFFGVAGCIAQKMGLPIELVAVVNDNDVVHRAIQHGDFSMSKTVKSTLASAMDIQEPYNMERIFWLFSGSDSNLVKSLMEEFYNTKSVKLPSELQKKLSEGLRSCTVSDEEILQTMRKCKEDNHYLLCPHTATAVCYHYKHSDCHPSIFRCCLAPASPVKFEDAVCKAGLPLEVSPEISKLKEMETRSCTLKRGEDWAKILQHQIEAVAKQQNSV